MPLSPALLAGLIGTGVRPSLTPPMHMAEGRAQGLDYVYRPIDLTELGLDADRLPEVLDWAERLGFTAVNVTHPCKQAVIPLLDRVDPAAERIGAVNTVCFTASGRIGYNTDTTGYERAFAAGLPGAAVDRVTQLGAGGAGSAVADALLRLGARSLTIVDVDGQRAQALADALAARHDAAVRAATPGTLRDLVAESDGLVQCTPIGMAHHPGTPIDPAFLRPELWVSDVIYRPIETELLRQARARGCATLDGGGMAVFQAVDAFRLITGREADSARMTRHFHDLLDGEQHIQERGAHADVIDDNR